MVPKVNSKPETEHVTNLAMLARLDGLEEGNLMYWVSEFGEEEGLMRAIDELLNRLNFETERDASEVLWKGEVLQVHLQVSRQPTKKEEVRFFISRFWCWFGNATSAWRFFFGGMVFGFARARLGGGMLMATSPPLVGGFLDPKREVSGLGLVGVARGGFQW